VSLRGPSGAVRDPQGPDGPLLRRVRWRLVAWSAGATLVVLAIVGVAIYVAVDRSLAANGQQQLQARADNVERFLSASGDGRRPPVELAVGGPSSGTFAYIVLPHGQVLGPAGVQVAGLPDAAGVAAAQAGAADVREVTDDGVPFRVLSQPVQVGGSTVVVQVAQETTSERQTLQLLTFVLLLTGLLGILGSVAVGFVYAGRALVPIRDALRRQREFAADASHELRTPLTVIRASVEHLERHPEAKVAEVGDTLEDLQAEVDHLTALVGDLLMLARTDSGVLELELAPTDLATAAEEAVGSAGALATKAGVHLVLDPAPVPITGDPARLRQLVTILVDNAIAHTPSGGAVTVRVRTTGAWGQLDVEDDGPGILPEDLPRVFDRFYRSSGAPSGGTGLGLSIAAWIVERHGGTIEAANRLEGGARFTVHLPANGPRTSGQNAVVTA
jgi:two-component system sensor histidine kinase CiaH